MNDKFQKDNFAKYTLVLFFLFFGLIFLRLFYLQLWRASYYSYLADNIRARVTTEIAPRGIIYDRYGQILAESRVIYALDVLPYQIKNPKFTFRFLRGIGIDTSKIEDKFAKKVYLLHEPLRVKNELSAKQISYLEENKGLLDGVIITSRVLRYYPNNNIASHVLGYVGEINSKELKNLKKYGYQIGDIVGLAGLERYYDKYLKGVNGGHPLEVDPLGNPTRKLESQDPIPGADLHLTIDLGLQIALEKAFGDRKGAAVIIDPSTGEVLAMLSKPDYNPNFFTDFLSEAEWQDIHAKEFPLHNRALSGYPPGSIFKFITFLTALESGDFDLKKKYYCTGSFWLGGRRFGCWLGSGHGIQNMLDGFIHSCNVVFYNIGLNIDPNQTAKNAAQFGLGLSTDIDLPYESTGMVPTPRWKARKYNNQDWYPGDSLNMAIGQGFILTTPLQMALAVGALANQENVLYRPYLADKIVSVEGKEIFVRKPEVVGKLDFKAENIALVKRLMQEVVEKGTGQNAKIKELKIAGKTGTAEVNNQKPHAWFVSFGPTDKPKLATVVFVEKGGFGGESAARITREVYTWYFQNRINSEVKNEKI